MRPHDYLIGDDPRQNYEAGPRSIDSELLLNLRRGPTPDHEDIEMVVPLARLIHDQLEMFGTGGGNEPDDDEMREALMALRVVLDRLGLDECEVPFRDSETFRIWWLDNGAHGSYQARRTLLHRSSIPSMIGSPTSSNSL
jgi:hypothetical protein